MPSTLSRGSEWRKWDLHIHSPLSALNNQFPKLNDGQPDWDAYLVKLESFPDLAVLGVTDYFTIEGYRKILEFRSAGRLRNIQTVLPNIEFRLDKLVGTANGHRRLNYHVLFSEQISPEEIEEHFLHEIKFCFEGDPQRTDLSWSIRRTNLELLGRKLKEEHSHFDDGRSDFEIGCPNATVDPSKIKDVLQQKERIFRGNFLIVLPEEHLSLLQWNGQDHHTRKLLLQGADAIFSSNPRTIAWSRGQGDINSVQFRTEFKSLKPCLHGSDAHTLDDIAQPAESRYCWIKADPTFEGLKQVLYEPKDRIEIADSPPLLKNDYQILESLQITGAPGWFTADEIPLNADLVSVIGPRGSGKSALAEMIAFAGGSDFFGSSEHIQDSFLFKASKKSDANPAPITGAQLTLKWSNGIIDAAQISTSLQHGKDEEKVKYLPQRFVEHLCAPENNRKLEEEIERVIFQRIDKTERLEASNFSELRQTSTKSISVKRDKLRRTIRSLNQSIAEAAIRISLKPSKENDLKRKQAELQALVKNVPHVPQASKEELERLESLIKLKEQVETNIVHYNDQLGILDTIETKFESLKDDVNLFNQEISALLEKVQLSNERDALVVNLPKEISEILRKRRSDLQTAIDTQRKGSHGAEGPLTLEKIIADIELIRAQSRLTETKKKEYEKFQRDRKLLEDSIASLQREIKEIDEVVRIKARADSDARLERYLDCFQLLNEEKAVLERLYGPLRTALLSSNETARKLEFLSKAAFDVSRHASDGLDLLDRRKALYGDQGELESALRMFFDAAEQATFDREKTKIALQALHESFQVQGDRKLSVSEQLRKERTTKDFADWFYGIDNFSVIYSIRFDGKELHLLSPGEKGVVLLLLYLEAEDQDNRPLIIDQPDDNLDNLSVYPSLTEYFRARKRTRQIVIITHNPNLVVNTDADQIFVATFDGARTPKILYRSGSLEDTNPMGPVLGIREEVCRILEGGTEAFQLREQRYSLT